MVLRASAYILIEAAMSRRACMPSYSLTDSGGLFGHNLIRVGYVALYRRCRGYCGI